MANPNKKINLPVSNKTEELIELSEDEILESKYTNEAMISEIQISELPSQMKPYPKNARIWYRPYTYAEIDYFSESKLEIEDSYLKILSGIRTRGFDPLDLTLMDFYFLSILRKLSTLASSSFRTKAYAKNGKLYDATFELTDIEFDDLKVPALPAVIKLGGKEAHFSPLTVRKYLELYQSNLHKSERAIIAAQCINLPFEEAKNLVDNAIGMELLNLQKVDELFDHGLLPVNCKVTYSQENENFNSEMEEHPITNPKMRLIKEVVKVNIDDASTLISPFRDERFSEGDGISFGL